MREIIITVYSGLCNRLFMMLCAMRISTKYGHKLTVFWFDRTGRYFMDYLGPLNSTFEDYFESIPNISVYPIINEIKFQYPTSLDIESTLPEYLPIDEKGQRRMPKELTLFIFGPKYVNIDPENENEKIVVQKSTKLFGVKEKIPNTKDYKALENMKPHINYLDIIGSYKKDEYLLALSAEAKKLRPVKFIQDIIDKEYEKFANFSKVYGIHIRGTDLEQLTTKDRKMAIMMIIKNAPDNTGFFVASDDNIDWLRNYMEKLSLSNRLITYDNKIKLENSIEGTQHAIVDLYLMSKCNKIYGTTNSSFSMLSWILSDNIDYTLHS